MRLRARYLAALLCGLAIIPIGFWRSHRQQARARLERWQERQAVEQTAESLERKIAIPAGPLTVAQLKRLIEQQTDLRVEFAELASWAKDYANDSSAAQWRLELPAGQYPIDRLLRLTLNQHGLTYDLDVRRIIITAEHLSDDSAQRYVEAYPLPQPESAASETDEDCWADLLTSASDYGFWPYTDGGGHIEPVPGSVVISHTARGHRGVRRLLAEFRKLKSPPPDFAPVAVSPDSNTEAHARILAVLSEPAAIDWVDRPLDGGLNALAIKHGIPLVINFKKLEEAAIPRDLPITKQLSRVSLRSLLQLMLSELELTYLFEDGALVVTTPDHANAAGLTLVAYPVHDLLGKGPTRDYERVIELVTTSVQPYSWSEVGGPASLQCGTIDGWLLVNQHHNAHEEIAFLLSQLRKALRHESSPGVFLIAKEDAREQAIRKALERELELQYDAMPLKDAVHLLADLLEIPVFINARKLEESAIRIDAPVRLRFPKRPAKQQLRSILSELELTWLVDDEVLQVATPDDAHSPDRLTTRLYDLRLLKDPDLGAASADRVLDVVREAIEPQSWDEVGGPGTLTLFEDVLVVSQNRDVHERLEQFLAAVHQHCTQLASEKPQPTWVDPYANSRDAEIAKSLLKPIDFTVKRTPIAEALERLSTEQRLPLVIDYGHLESYGTDPKTEIDFEARQMTIGGVLDRLLEPFDGTYIIEDGAVLVTSKDNATNQPLPRLYNREQIARKIATPPTNLSLNLINVLPRFSSQDDIGMSIELNQRWLVYYASEPVQRRVELKLAPASTHAQAVAERVALDLERDETGDWQFPPSGYRVTAAQQYHDPQDVIDDLRTEDAP